MPDDSFDGLYKLAKEQCRRLRKFCEMVYVPEDWNELFEAGMLTKWVVGIDPGANGAAVIFCVTAEEILLKSFVSFKLDSSWVRTLHEDFLDNHTPAYIENVHSFAGQGVKSMFSFGRNLGKVEAILELNHTPTTLIEPREWQRQVGLIRVEGDRKKAHEAKAKELYPVTANHDKKNEGDIFDAVLIGHIGAMKIMEDLKWQKLT